jgi:hypothetical protein
VEQVRLLRKLARVAAPGGLLVLESATARRILRSQQAVEVWWPPYRDVESVTHVPGRGAIVVWLRMVGWDQVRAERVYSRELAPYRAVFTAIRPQVDTAYSVHGAVAGEAP